MSKPLIYLPDMAIYCPYCSALGHPQMDKLPAVRKVRNPRGGRYHTFRCPMCKRKAYLMELRTGVCYFTVHPTLHQWLANDRDRSRLRCVAREMATPITHPEMLSQDGEFRFLVYFMEYEQRLKAARKAWKESRHE